MSERCAARLWMYDGEYEGECELPEGHPPPHFDGLTTWETDESGSRIDDSIDRLPPPSED